MCEPATLTLIATGVAAAGQIVGGVMKAQQQTFQARVADQNARLANNQAMDALQRGKLTEQASYRQTSQLMGAQRAALAANGVEVDFGSAADLQADTRMIGREEAGTIRENTMREVQGYEIDAANSKAGAAAARSARTAGLVSTAFDVAGTVLGGAQQYKKIGAARSGAGASTAFG